MATQAQNDRLRAEAELPIARERVVARVADAYRKQPRGKRGVLSVSAIARTAEFPGLPCEILIEASAVVYREDTEKRRAEVDRWVLEQDRAA